MLTYTSILVVPWLIGLALTPLLIRLGTRSGWVDRPDERKRHGRPIPFLGGLSIFGSVALGLVLLAPFIEPLREGLWGPRSLLTVGAGTLAIVTLGLIDDVRDLSPLAKLTAQLSVAVGTWALGLRVAELSLPFDPTGWSGVAWSLGVTVGWLVIVTNAFNLIDGMDGLACGIAIIASLTVFLLANHTGATAPVIGTLAMSGALAAFLRYNLPPARIFLGDSGSMGIGYATAALSLGASQKAPTGLALIVPLLVVGLPMLDTLIAILRRGFAYMAHPERARRRSPLAAARAIFRADRGHIHHLLLRCGMSVPQVLALLYTLSLMLAILGWWSRTVASQATWLIWLTLLGVGFLAARLIQRRVDRLEAAEALAGVSPPDAAPAEEPARTPVRRAAGRKRR